MRPMQLVPALLILLVAAACGGSADSGDDGGGGGDPSQAAESMAPAASAGGDGGGTGGGGTSGEASVADLEELAEHLKPPNSIQVQETTGEGTIVTTYESNVSVDGLLGHYNLRIPETGLEVYSSTFADGTQTWLFAEGGDASRFGGSVTIGPGANGTSVIVLVTSGQ